MRRIIFGDIHGCIEELEIALSDLGIVTIGSDPEGKRTIYMNTVPEKFTDKLIFLGDLFDRGPNSYHVYFLIRYLTTLYGKDKIIVVRGNHDDKLRRYLKGNPIRIGKGLQMTIDQFGFVGNEELKTEVHSFLDSLPYIYEDEAVIGVHAALVNSKKEKTRNELALYGLCDQTVDKDGFLVRHMTWVDKYEGTKPVFFGHVVHDAPTVRNAPNAVVVALDTGAVFGGGLSYAIVEEGKLETFTVPSVAVHFARKDAKD